jgi:hypothetical protein
MGLLKELALLHPFTPPSKILLDVKSRFPKEVCQAVPDDANLSRSIRRWRQPLGMKEPKTRQEIVLTELQKLDLDVHLKMFPIRKPGLRNRLVLYGIV